VEFAIFVVIMIIASVVAKAKQQSSKSGTPNPRVQKLIERIQAEVQRNGGPPLNLGPKYSQYAQPQPQPPAPAPYQPPAQFQPAQYAQPQYQPGPYQPAPYQPQFQQGQRQPAPRKDTDTQVRELMNAGNEVAAIRLLCDDKDLGILEAQEYARNLVSPAQNKPAQNKPANADPDNSPEPEAAEESRYVGSAAFAESIFDLDRDEETWASGWVDEAEPEDRSDIDELWQTVRNPPRPGTTPAS